LLIAVQTMICPETDRIRVKCSGSKCGLFFRLPRRLAARSQVQHEKRSSRCPPRWWRMFPKNVGIIPDANNTISQRIRERGGGRRRFVFEEITNCC